jgi:pantoate kinase
MDLSVTNYVLMAVPWLRLLVSPRRPGFDSGSVHVGFVVDKVALGQFSQSTSVFLVNFIPLALHCKEKLKKIIFSIIFITELHNKPQGCGASVASAAGPFATKKTMFQNRNRNTVGICR